MLSFTSRKKQLHRYTQWKSPVCPPDPIYKGANATERQNLAGEVHGSGLVTINKDFDDALEHKRQMYVKDKLEANSPLDNLSTPGDHHMAFSTVTFSTVTARIWNARIAKVKGEAAHLALQISHRFTFRCCLALRKFVMRSSWVV